MRLRLFLLYYLFLNDTESNVADSQEQADVMREILKRGVKIDDLM